jgi:hypothetical protein
MKKDRRKWTDKQLKNKISECKSWKDLCESLGLLGTSQRNVERVKKRAEELGLNFDHFSWSRRKYTLEDLKQAVDSSLSYRQVLIHMGLNASGSAHRKIKESIEELGLDTSHFLGRSSCKGIRRGGRIKFSLDEILVKDSPYRGSSSALKKKLLSEEILEEKCDICGIEEWYGEKVPTELDHINGEVYDHRIENLRIVCRNCGGVLPTFAGRNAKS